MKNNDAVINEAMSNVPWSRQDRGFHAADMTTKTTAVMGQSGPRRRRSQRQVAAGEGCDWTDPRPPAAHWLSGHDLQVLLRDPSTAGRCPSDGQATRQYLCGEPRPPHRTIRRRSRRRNRRRCCPCRRKVRRHRQSPGRCEFLGDSSEDSPDNVKPIRHSKQLKCYDIQTTSSIKAGDTLHSHQILACK